MRCFSAVTQILKKVFLIWLQSCSLICADANQFRNRFAILSENGQRRSERDEDDDSNEENKKKINWKEPFQQNFVWISLGLVLAGALGASYFRKYIINEVKTDIKGTLSTDVFNILNNNPQASILKDSYDRANKAYSEAADLTARGNALLRLANEKHRESEIASTKSLSAASEIENRLKEIKNQIEGVSFFKEVDKAINDQKFKELVLQRILPAGAIFAFDLPTGCPSGWRDSENLKGRFIVGASRNNKNLDENGNPLGSYEIGKSGGEEKHKLIEDEMPSHSHQSGLYGDPSAKYLNPNGGGKALRMQYAWDGAGNAYFTTDTRGKGDAHNNMPPYLALYFCQKE